MKLQGTYKNYNPHVLTKAEFLKTVRKVIHKMIYLPQVMKWMTRASVCFALLGTITITLIIMTRNSNLYIPCLSCLILFLLLNFVQGLYARTLVHGMITLNNTAVIRDNSFKDYDRLIWIKEKEPVIKEFEKMVSMNNANEPWTEYYFGMSNLILIMTNVEPNLPDAALLDIRYNVEGEMLAGTLTRPCVTTEFEALNADREWLCL